MPRSTDPENYPAEYLDMCRRAALSGERIVVRLPTWTLAKKMYANFFSGYVASLNRVRKRTVEVGREPSPKEQEYLDDLLLIRKVQWTLEHDRDTGTGTITIRSKAQNEFAIALRNAIIVQDTPLPPTQGEQEFEEMTRRAAGITGATVVLPATKGLDPDADIGRLERLAKMGNRQATARLAELRALEEAAKGIFGDGSPQEDKE